MDINLHIERLVLDGVDIAPGQGDLLHATVINQLTQLFATRGLASNIVGGASLSKVEVSNIQFCHGKPQSLGQQIAKSVYGGIGRE